MLHNPIIIWLHTQQIGVKASAISTKINIVLANSIHKIKKNKKEPITEVGKMLTLDGSSVYDEDKPKLTGL